ncbi:hypothetical protein ACIQCR_20195 [Streptomyces sp. NPDC093249]|uniref:hypothetical protein n=1 Tax=unclassified Streptomyces TaxID=2593676 RepID=UPI00381CC418
MPVPPHASGADSGWSVRLTRLGAPRPGPAARRARRFGVPVVPMLVAGLVAAAFLTVRGGAGQETELEGRPGGDPSAVSGEGRSTGMPYGDPGTLGGTRSDDATPLADAPVSGTSLPDTPDTAPAGTPTSVMSAPGVPGDGGPSEAPAPTGRTATSKPSRAGPGAPTRRPAPTGPSGDRPGGAPVSFEHLRVGDCFDIDRATPGTALRRACDRPHHAELVARPRLTGRYATDQAIREAATLLCRAPLSRKAARQSLGTRWTTFVQYPYRTSHLLGSVHAACSLAAPSGDRFSHRLR